MKYSSLGERIQKGHHSISRAPLKPCQRLFILKKHLLPSLVHGITFDKTALKALKAADVAIRGALRRWLRLPKDTTNAFLHASVKFGGLGVLQLKSWIPEVRIQRMTKVVQQAKRNEDGFLIEYFHHNTTVMSEVRRFGKPQPNIKSPTRDSWGATVSNSRWIRPKVVYECRRSQRMAGGWCRQDANPEVLAMHKGSCCGPSQSRTSAIGKEKSNGQHNLRCRLWRSRVSGPHCSELP